MENLWPGKSQCVEFTIASNLHFYILVFSFSFYINNTKCLRETDAYVCNFKMNNLTTDICSSFIERSAFTEHLVIENADGQTNNRQLIVSFVICTQAHTHTHKSTHPPF